MTDRESRLQDGIYVGGRDDRPGSCYRLLLCNVKENTHVGEAERAIAIVWALLQELRSGVVAELAPEQTPEEIARIRQQDLRCLVGFGSSFFDRYPRLIRPPGVKPLGDTPFGRLPWVSSQRGTGEADLAFQLTGKTNLAVDRAAVEVWMLIRKQSLPLEVVTFYSGFNREDGRSWIGFHDGISNIAPTERVLALEITQSDAPWMNGGTYMAFLRLALDLEGWRNLKRPDQESIVGRNKLTGCPIMTIGPGPLPVPVPGCPVGPQASQSEAHVNPPPPPPSQDVVRASHIHRANPSRLGAADDANNRIFRQGYEFVESAANHELRLGLNFVSFQRSLTHLINILTLPGWLGTANFGGFEDAQPGQPTYVSIVSLIAGGYYAVPPKGEPFPGADMFA